MIVRCRFCGQKINSRDEVCEHCGKSLVAKKSSDDTGSVIGREAWEQKSIPAWLIYTVIAIGIFLLGLLFTRGGNDLIEPTATENPQPSAMPKSPTKSP